jgi:hypothetical protein
MVEDSKLLQSPYERTERCARYLRSTVLNKSAAGLPETLGALRTYKDLAAKLPQRTVKDELRENLICRIQKH